MRYESSYPESSTTTAEIVVTNEDAALLELFGHFIRMTEMMGYQAGSWERIIDKAYGDCVIHANSSNEYNIFDFGLDSITLYS
jgi:hypothetical protein